jgi:hypothetical protein
VSGQLHAPAALPSVPIGQEVSGSPEPVWTPPRLELRPFGRPAHSRYTDYAIPAEMCINRIIVKF